jgi:hypothetical protein
MGTGLLAITALTCGPLLPAWQLEIGMSILPGMSWEGYRLMVSLPWLLSGLFIYKATGRQIIKIRDVLSEKVAARISWIVLFALLLTALLIELGVLYSPLRSNDPVQYAKIAELAYYKGGFDFYPMSVPVDDSGFLTYMRHPTGYPSGILWHYLIQQRVDFGAAKLVVLWQGLMLFLIVVWLLRGVAWRYRLLAIGMLMASPLLIYQIGSHAIDPMYLSLSVLVIALLTNERFSSVWKSGVLIGVVSALTFRQHSVGAVLVVCIMLSYLLAGGGALRERMRISLIAASLALVLGAGQYVGNVLSMGVPVADTTMIWSMPELARDDFIRQQYGINTLGGRLWNGLFLAWSQPWYYGVLPWLALPAMASAFPLWRRSALLRMVVTLVCVYMLLNLLLIAFGNDTAIRGPRYFLVLLPMFAITLALGVAEWRSRHNQIVAVRCPIRGGSAAIWSILIVFFAPILVVALSNYYPMNRLVNGDREWFVFASKQPDSVEYLVAEVARRCKPSDRVLTDRNDRLSMFTSVRYMRDLDQRLVAFYEADTVDDAFLILQKLGVTHMLTSSASTATTSHKNWRAITENPAYSRVIFENRAGTLVALTQNQADGAW